jgi:hypothetical protein
MRIAGSQNFKQKYSPTSPYIRIVHITPGLITTPEQLTRLGLVAPVDQPRARPSRVYSTRPGNRKWPSYQRCVEGAPPKSRKHRRRHQPRRVHVVHDGN